MGKFCEMSDGVFLLEIKIGTMYIKRAFVPADIALSDISKKPMPEGFYLYIPDNVPDNFSEEK